MTPQKINTQADKEQNRSQEKELKATNDGEHVKAAHEQAEEDIQQDADLSVHSPNDDLDEAETVRLGEDKNDLT